MGSFDDEFFACKLHGYALRNAGCANMGRNSQCNLCYLGNVSQLIAWYSFLPDILRLKHVIWSCGVFLQTLNVSRAAHPGIYYARTLFILTLVRVRYVFFDMEHIFDVHNTCENFEFNF